MNYLTRLFKRKRKLYSFEPEIEPAKETEIVAHKQHATCLMCGKEIEGLLDRHATVSIKRYSISSLYESTYSHYCGKCFLELGFDATERELRNRQQPIAEPEPEPQYKVGDWVEMDYKGTLYHRQVISVHDNGIRVEFGGATPLISFDGKSSMLLIRLVRKLKPNEVEVPINISGTVRQAYNEDGTIDDEQFQLLPNGIWDGTEMFISFDALDSHTRKLVESLLKAQEEEK